MRLFPFIHFAGLSVLVMSSCEPSTPIVEFDSEKAIINFIQTDKKAQDSAYISIGDICHKVIPINGTVAISIPKSLKEKNQIEAAYTLATLNNTLDVSVHTSRTNDTTLCYQHKTFDIKSIPVAEVLTGPCCGLYDVNYNRDYHVKIRQWFFQKKIDPDSIIIEKTNSLLRQFNYSGTKEYSTINSHIPIVNNLSGQKFRFRAHLNGDFFYLYAYPCKSGKPIDSFIEYKISKGFVDANHSVNDVFTCSNSGDFGPNVLFLIGIDKNWKYEVLPVGIIIIDNVAPTIIPLGHSRMTTITNYNNHDLFSWPKTITFQKHNILINIPTTSSDISSSVSVSYGDFEGNDYFGYNIPFYINITGDIKSITIGKYRLNGNSIKNGECIRLHINSLHIGDNSLPLSAIDSRGNKSVGSLSFHIVSIRDNDNDYSDLEDRISDLEYRVEDLE